MSGLDWFPFYAADWLADDRVQAMTNEERGVFVTLLAHAWRADATLPKDRTRLARMARVSRDELEALLDGVLGECWIETDDGLSNPKLTRVLEEQTEKSRKRTDAARKANESRWKKSGFDRSPSGSEPDPTAVRPDPIREEEIREEEKNPEGASAPTRDRPARRGRAKVKHWDAALEGDHADLLESHPAVVEWTAYLAERLPRAHQARTVENQIGKIRSTPPEEFRRLVDLAIGSGWQGWHFPDRNEGPTTSAKACASVRERVDVRGAFESSFLKAQRDPAKLAELRSRLQAKSDLGAEDRADIGAVLDAADAGEPEAALARFCEKSRALYRGEEVSR